MAVAFRASSSTGASDNFAANCPVPVPTGVAAGDIALVGVERFAAIGEGFTGLASGFTQILIVESGSEQLAVFWKRLTGADTGTYTFSWTTSHWNAGVCIAITGAATTGTPYGGSGTNTVTGTTTSIGTTTVTSTGAPFLAHFVANESAASGAPPTSFTETQENEYIRANYRIPGTTGSHSASGATLSVASAYAAALIAIEPDTGGGSPSVTKAITQPRNRARINRSYFW